MPRRYFNWKLAIVLIIGIGVLGVTAFGLRQWQRTNRADQGLILGNKAYDEQNWEEAAENLGRYLAVMQDDVPALLKYAEAQLKIKPSERKNIQQAINAYRVVLRTDKNNSKAIMQLTEVYLMMGMPGEAELIAGRWLETETNDDPELRRMLALALAQQRKFTEAAAQLNTILQKHPDQILAYETLGRLTEQRPDDISGFPPEHWFNKAVNNNPSSALAYMVRAGFYRRSEDSAKALADLEQAEKQDLSDPNVELRLAGEFIIANDLDKAEQHLTAVQAAASTDATLRSSSLRSTSQRLWATWAELALKSQSREKMLKIAEAGLKELSSQPWDFMPIATELFIRSGQLDRAADCISEMNQKDVAPVTVAFLQGLVAVERGHLLEAINYWQESMGLGNTSPQVRLALSSVLSRLGNTQSALRHLRSLISERPDFSTGHLALAKLLAQSENWAESAKHAATAMQLSPGNPEPVLLYLQARMQLLPESSANENAQAWQDIEKRLSELEKATDGALGVKLLQFQFALRQDNYANARVLVAQMKKDHPSRIKVAMAEVELLVVQDKTDEAILILFKTLEEFPQAVEPVRYLAILLDRQGDQEKCEAIIKDALERIDQPVNQRTLGLLLAEFYTRWNQKDNVYLLLNRLEQKLTEDVPLKRWLLLCKQVIEDPEKAQQLVNEIKLLEGEDGWQWRYEQARVWFSSENFEARYAQIVSLLQKNLQANPNDRESRILLAAAYDRSGELQMAISTYREGVSRYPDDLRIIMPTVVALFKAKEYDEADQLLKRASTSQQKLYSPQIQQLRLQSHLRRGELSLASDILQDFLRNDPNNQASRLQLALLKTQQSRFDEAKELLDELKARSPDSLLVTYAQIQLNIRQDKSEEALKICDELVNNLNNASAYILRARTYTTLKLIDKAMEDLERAADIEPNNIEVWIIRSKFYLSMGRLDKAIADILQALSLDSSNVQVQKHAIPLLFASGDSDKVHQGKAVLETALQSNPEDIDLRLFKANSLSIERTAPSIEQAEQILQKMTEDRPEISRAWELLGEISLSQGQAGRAMDAASRGLAHTPNDKRLLLLKARAEAARSPVLAIPTLKVLYEVDPNNTDTTLHLANIYIAAGEPDKAVNLLKSQLISRLGSSEARRIKVALAVALHKNGNKAESKMEFDSLIQSEPDDPTPLLNQVGLLRDEQLWTQLRQKAAQWYQKHPKDSHTLINIAGILMATKDSWDKKIPEDVLRQSRKTAEDILRMILENDRDSVKAMTVLAILLQTRGRLEESVPLYQRVLELQPDNLIVMNNLAWIMCEDKGRPQEALELAQRGLKISPNYIDLIDTRGVIYYQLGEFDRAVEDFTTCIRLYPTGTSTTVTSHFHLAKAFAKLGQKDKAAEHLDLALGLNRQAGALSTSDLDEARDLLKQLREGN